jgi:hypothetical protein
MDLKKVIVVAFLVIAGLVYLKKHYVDKKNDAHVASQTEAAAEALGRAQSSSLKIKSESAQPAAPTSTDTTASAASTTDTAALAAALSQMLGSSAQNDGRAPEERAKERVKSLMQAWQAGGTSLNDSAQAAICYWSRGSRFIPDAQDLTASATAFDDWRREKDLYTSVNTFDVLDSTFRRNDPGRGGDYTVVQVMINGATYRIGVPDTSNPMFWTF